MGGSGGKLSVSVVGAGSWGGTMAQYLSRLGHSVTVWHRNKDELAIMAEKRIHPFVPRLRFGEEIQFVSHLSSLTRTEIIVLGVPSHGVRETVEKLRRIDGNTVIVNLAKGIENDTLMRMSQVICEAGRIDASQVVTLSGPSHAEEVAQLIPTTVVAAGASSSTTEFVQRVFSSDIFRVYASTDIVGVELGGSVKNVIAIAAGVCDGIGFGDNTKAALITRGIVEITRLGVAMGARSETFSGLSGIGDLIVTCLSQHSRNRAVGEKIARGEKLDTILNDMKMVAEGVKTTTSVHELQSRHGVEMPICEAVHSVLFRKENPRKAVKNLMTRELTYEHN